MKIETSRNKKFVKFSEIKAGEVFKVLDENQDFDIDAKECSEEYFMRISILRISSTRTDAVYNAIRLDNGYATKYDPDCTVMPVDAKVVIIGE